jgi:hypothetical protein
VLVRFIVRTALRAVARATQRIDGVLVLANHEESAELFQCARAAFALLRSAHPKAWRRLQRLAWCVFLDDTALAVAGSWDPRTGCVTLSAHWARETPRLWSIDPARAMASTLVHETTHARHTELGIRNGAATRLRREIHCVREQMRFAKRLGDARLVAKCARKLESPLPGRVYYERLHEEVRRLRAPRAIAWVLSMLIERRRRNEAATWRALPAPAAQPRRPRVRRSNFQRRA